ncbi:CIC11C00000004228 [Sungouiella intermedia]|uniref:CIC11C00000004228 n=1 Tax=Sungouiella intermedia TaxID=45354 RepID=A0A1L0C596_9ASCO|nr:CIC11C00000004228 [[Candida] intermedia]
MLNYRALSLVDQQVVDVEYSRDGSYLAVAFAQDTTIKVYDCDTLEQLYEVPNSSAGKSGFLALKWLPHRANFVYVAENGRVVEFAKRDQKIGK